MSVIFGLCPKVYPFLTEAIWGGRDEVLGIPKY